MARQFEQSAVIEAPPSAVWEALTVPELMSGWMAEPEVRVEVETDWAIGGPITVRGVHHARFVNDGTVLQFVPNEALRYTHRSSLSRLPDRPESYSVFEFRLAPAAAGTSLTIAVKGAATEVDWKHLEFYWRGTLGVLKRFVEQRASSPSSPASSPVSSARSSSP
jgi:uncharacterized protein YndB with AHSA1/START domain